LYNPTCGALRQRSLNNPEARFDQNHGLLSIRACDGLQLVIAVTFQSLETVEETSFPALHYLQTKFFHTAELNSLPAPSSTAAPQPSYRTPESKHQLLLSLQELDATLAVPFGSPSFESKFLGNDVFYSLQM
jgi:hypothetical protein